MLISQSELARRLGVERLTIHRWYKAGKLPEQVVKNKNKLGWEEEVLDSFFRRDYENAPFGYDVTSGYRNAWFRG